MAIVRTHGASASASAPAAAAGDVGGVDGSVPRQRYPGAQVDQSGRERVVLLMHETSVLTASDTTRVLLLLAREVRVCRQLTSTH